jgi:hypothetical protein
MSDYILRNVGTSQIDDQGRAAINGLQMKRLLDDPRFKQLTSKIYSKKELENLNKVADQLSRFQKLAATKALPEGSLNDKPAWILDRLSRLVGARLGAQMAKGTSGGSIQAAGQGASSLNQILKKLTGDKALQVLNDAVLGGNDELLIDLLKYRPSLPKKVKIPIERRFHTWALTSGARLFTDQEREEMKEFIPSVPFSNKGRRGRR